MLDVQVHDLRDYTTDRHRSVDDVPYGGGPGMVMKPEPLVRAVEAIRTQRGTPDAVILLSPQGRRFTQAEAERLSRLSHVVLLCGRYEGMDERVPELVGAEEISLGDFVVSGGELPAHDRRRRGEPTGSRGRRRRAVGGGGFVRARAARLPALHAAGGVRGHEGAGRAAVGTSCRRAAVARKTALERTLERRPDLIEQAALDDEDRELLDEIHEGEESKR